LAVTLSASNLPPGAVFEPNTGNFDWKPLLSGAYVVVFKATNSLGIASTKETSIQVSTGRPRIVAATNGANYSRELVCSPGALAILFGEDFTEEESVHASQLPLPTQLGGLRVKINDVYAPLLHVSPTQVNFQCPDIQTGERLSISVVTETGTSTALDTAMLYSTPGIFTLDGSGGGQGAILLADRPRIAMVRTADVPSQPALPGDYISIYAQGLGPTQNGPAPGHPAGADPLSYLEAPIRVMIGGVNAEVTFAGLVPGFVGLCQVNARIPTSVQTGDRVPLVLMVTEPGGEVRSSNMVTIAIEPGR